MNREKEIELQNQLRIELRNRMRIEMEQKLIEWHNDHEEYEGNCYNCKALGIVELWFRGKWQTRWIVVSPLPFDK